MINSYREYKNYLVQDMAANKVTGISSRMRITWKFIVAMRQYELALNCQYPLKKLVIIFARLKYHYLSVKSGIQIPPNTFGAGLYIPHFGAIVVNETAKFGSDCVIQCGVNISENAGGGTHVYFGAGCKVMKNVYLSDNVIIGANAVVTKSVLESDITVGGIPAKKILNYGYKNRNTPV